MRISQLDGQAGKGDSRLPSQPAPGKGPDEVASLMAACEDALQRGDYRAAFDHIHRAKAMRQPRQGIDHLRARCFVGLGQPGDARESLAEELRYFPGNAAAAGMLEDLKTRYPEHFASGIQDPEFRPLLARIRRYSMVPEARLHALYQLAKQVCKLGIPGNFVECGVAAGGSSAMLAHVIRTFSASPRAHFAFDSFEGMPPPGEMDMHGGKHAESTGWGTGTCAAPEASLMEIAAELGVADLVHPVKGYFSETLPASKARIGPIALLHMDGDWYESTRDILENLYDQVVPGGLIQVDDYGHWDGCKRALHEFADKRGLQFPIKPVDHEGVWFQKP